MLSAGNVALAASSHFFPIVTTSCGEPMIQSEVFAGA
jgi:hypothetical protein